MKSNKIILFCVGLSLIYLFWGITTLTALQYIVWKRLLRLIAVYVVSYTTSVSTVYFQTIVSNNIVTPALLGIDKIYLLVQIIMTTVLGIYIPSSINYIVSISVMAIVTSVTYSYLMKMLKYDIFKLMLVGIVGGTLIQSIITTMGMMMDPNEYSILQSYSIASLNDISLERLMMSLLILVPLIVMKVRLDGTLDLMGLGKSWAQNYGVNTEKFQRKGIILVSCLSAISTALIGPNLFLGLIIVSISRKYSKKYDHKMIIKISSLVGVCLLLVSQITLERFLNLNGSLGFGISILGGLIFCITLYKETT